MLRSWADWKPFPDSTIGEYLDAPIGPGVYEVRHTETGEIIAFGNSAEVAQALTDVIRGPAGWGKVFGRKNASHRASDLEYRTCAARSAREAKSVAERLRGRRAAFWQRRNAWA